jgi:hypothetical protein
MLERWSKYIGAWAAWLVVVALAMVILLVGGSFLQSFTVNILKDEAWTKLNSVQASYTVTTIMNFYYLLTGILFLGFFILMENRLVSTGIRKKLVLRRTAFTLGIELLILAFFQLAMFTYLPSIPLQIGLAVLELLFGVGLIYLARRKAPIVPSSQETK